MEHDTHIGSGLKAQCLVSIRSPLPTNAQWIDFIRIVQKVSIYDWFVTSVGDQKPKKYWGKKMTFLRIFWLRAKSHHSIFPWSSDLMISNLISTSFYFVKKIGIFNAIYILVFCDYVLKNYGYFNSQIKSYRVKVEYILKKKYHHISNKYWTLSP